MNNKIGAAALALATFGGLLTAAPAIAGTDGALATGSWSVGTEYGNTLRAEFRQNTDGSGYYWRTFGSGNCTATTSDVDISISDMSTYPNNWDNTASWAKDQAACDTRLYRYSGFSTELTSGWTNYGSGASLAAINDLTSSYKLS
ncbi:MAG: hypothetical protein ACTHNS_16165 [Marmoricola sp.]